MDKSGKTAPNQANRFKEKAREFECDENESALEKALNKLDLKRKPTDAKRYKAKG